MYWFTITIIGRALQQQYKNNSITLVHQLPEKNNKDWDNDPKIRTIMRSKKVSSQQKKASSWNFLFVQKQKFSLVKDLFDCDGVEENKYKC